jgi:hypothetical protein
MSNYDSTKLCYNIGSGQKGTFFDAEQPAPPQASERFNVPQGRLGSYSPSVNIEGYFSADPGAFEIDIQEADTDTDTAFMTVPSAGVVNAVDSNFRFRVDLAPFVGTFIRLLLVSRTNAVNLTAQVTRR